ncbi:MAG TPA: aldose 1-epimerase family protein [Acidimicrobiales bacterium]|nr:aldose 1-epimerase family protein [Acidimicrobiales bacterium]
MPTSTQQVPPSGFQIELSSGRQAATVVEVGGALRSYTVDGQPLFDGYDLEERCTGARGQTLIPWPNRLKDGTYTFGDGDTQHLPLTEPDKHNAIHGLVRWANWSVVAQADEAVTVAHVLHPQSGWPYTLALSITYRLGPGGLGVTTTATNVGSSPCPYGTGAHPYLRLATSTVDPLHLQAPGRTWLPTDDQGIPTGVRPVDGTDYDFRSPRPIGNTVLDTGYGDLERGADGRARVRLVDPHGGGGVELWMDDAYGFVMLFTGDSLPQERRRRAALGVEPMTCPPDALRSGTAVVVLGPGEAHTAEWGITPLDPSGPA